MTSLISTTVRMPVAHLGDPNPLPLLRSVKELHEVDADDLDPAVTPEMLERLQLGHPVGVYPYLTQDGYTRDLSEQDVRVAVLDNGLVKATFLLDYGGRLWSLEDRASGRNLLHNPGMIRLGNLALRNAWFAGGVEWNIGTTGHSPTTCEPMHAALVEGPDGQVVLRLYEYERLRGVVFQIDAWLPEGSRFLKVYVRIQNPTDVDVPIYWWSNAAVAEAPGVRVIAPADVAWHFGYEGRLEQVPLPEHGGADISYTTRSAHPADYFFRVRSDDQPWVAAVDHDGRGVVQTSTPRLRGRKLFRWGTGTSGRTWQGWLGDTEDPYLEIQAGLAETQLEHLLLPAGERWDWVEAYGPISTDGQQAHGDWSAAQQAVHRALAEAVPAATLEADLGAAREHADLSPRSVIGVGSGWGALEQRRRRQSGDAPIADGGTPFDGQTLGEEQAPWLELLETGSMSVSTPPVHHPLGADWATQLMKCPQTWVTAYLAGLQAHALGDTREAKERLEASLALQDNAWALRALGLLDLADGDAQGAAERYLAALRQQPDLVPLARETIEVLLRCGRAQDALALLGEQAPDVRRLGRFRMLEAQAAAAAGHTERAREILRAGVVVDDLREGESALSDLWQELYPGSPVPEVYDFRMVPPEGQVPVTVPDRGHDVSDV